MRNLYLVSYDISDPKRWRQVFSTMRGFGEHLQYSVFLCDLSYKEKAILIGRLNEIIHHDEDSVIIVNLGGEGSQVMGKIESIGRAIELPSMQATIV